MDDIRSKELPIEHDTFPASRSGLTLDLYNFESVYAEDSPYVLTSPRSLEACAQLNIKPVELLLKPLCDFEEECLLSGRPINYAQHMHEAYETNRLEKLKFCRQIREKISLEDDNMSDSEENNFLTDDKEMKSRAIKATSSLSSSLKHPAREAKHIAVVELGQGDPADDLGCYIQTAKPCTEDTKSPNKTARTRQRPVSAKIGWKSKPRSHSAHRSQSAQSRGSLHRSNSFGSVPNSGMMSMISSKVYGSGRSSKMSSLELLSERDKRILEILEAKHLVQEEGERVKHMSRLAWEEEKAEEDAARAETERQRRQKLIEATQRRQRKQERRRRQRLEEQRSSLELSHRQLQHDEDKHKRLVDVQNQLKALEIHHRKMQETEKKRRQERHLGEREKDEEEFRQTVEAHQKRSLERAAQVKHRKEEFEIRERHRRNTVERSRHEALRESVNKQSEEEADEMQHFVRLKHDRSERTLQSHAKYREQQLQYQRERALVKQLRNHQSKQELENDMAEWKQHLLVKRQRSLERAVQQSSQTILQKARKASDVRRSREKIHKELLDRVKEDEETEKSYIKEKIAYKDYKTRVHSSEKNKAMERSREIAKVSAEFRDNIRKRYSGTFDKLVKRAELEARVGHGPQSSYKNVSTPGLF